MKKRTKATRPKVKAKTKEETKKESKWESSSKTTTQSDDPWGLVMRNAKRFIRLGAFGDIATPPRIADVEVAVCFADIRGFTAYCNSLQQRSLDNRIQNFLRDYFEIYAIAVLRSIWSLEPDDKSKELSENDARIRDIIVPSTYKNLGDGVLLVWEIPPQTPNVVQGRVTHEIFQIVLGIDEYFQKFFLDPGMVEVDAYSDLIGKLKMGFGLARGHAWKFDFGPNLAWDYAGSIINLAARLVSKARPEGIVCQYDFSHALFDSLIKKKIGTSKKLPNLKGLGGQKVVMFDRKDIVQLIKS